jgi:hypothetical protein
MTEIKPNDRFDALLRDLERLRNSPPPKPAQITPLISKVSLDQPLVKGRSITSRKRKAAIALKRSGGTQPAKQLKRSIMVFLKNPQPLTKAVAATPPRLVWTGRTPKFKLPAGSHIEGWS